MSFTLSLDVSKSNESIMVFIVTFSYIVTTRHTSRSPVIELCIYQTTYKRLSLSKLSMNNFNKFDINSQL